MTSSINPFNINGAYPVAGQDNNSQGFRDNFTNTGTNFQFAANEITDLQNKAVLKAPLIGTTLDNNMGGSVLSNAKLQNMGATVLPLGTLTGPVVINYTLGSLQTVTTGGPISLSFSNTQPSGIACEWTVQITVTNVAHTVQFPATVSQNAVGIQGFNTANRTITFAATGIYNFTFSTSNGGADIRVSETNQALQAYNSSSQDFTTVQYISTASYSAGTVVQDNLLNYYTAKVDVPASTALSNTAFWAPGTILSLATTTSYFATAAEDSTLETATLAAGVAGQIKVLAMTADSGPADINNNDMQITVANAGWVVPATVGWSEPTTYSIGDKVLFEGLSYVSLQNSNVNQAPDTQAAFWRLMSTITFSTIGQACTLQYINNKWYCIGNNGCEFA
jgi:hypothetical protein